MPVAKEVKSLFNRDCEMPRQAEKTCAINTSTTDKKSGINPLPFT